MKKFFKQCLSVLLVVITIFSMTTMGLTSFSATETQTVGIDLTDSVLADAALKRVGGRLFAEFTSYCISNKVPVLGSAFYVLLCDPATRSTIKMQGQVDQILADITTIKQDIDNVLQDLDEIYMEIEKNDAENKYADAKTNVDKYYIDDPGVTGYQTLWNTYLLALEYYDAVNQARESLKLATDPTEIKRLNKEIADNEQSLKTEIERFVIQYQNVFFVSGEKTEYSYEKYAKDMNNLNNYICTESKLYTEFLPALENMLRTYYPYEHQITEQMLDGFQYCQMVQYQIYIIHREYASYCEAMKYAGSSFDEIPELPEDFFAEENELYKHNIEQQILNSGIHTFMVTESTLDEADTISTLDEADTIPYLFDTTVKIGGTDVPCYIIRDNKDLSYYVITQETFKSSELINGSRHYVDMWIYKPNEMFDTLYTDNGEFKMISSLSEVTSLSKNPLNYFRNSGMEKIPEDVGAILLYNDAYQDMSTLSPHIAQWNIKFADSRAYDSNHPESGVTTYSSKDLYYGEADVESYIKIYKSTYNDSLFANNDNTFVVEDYDSMPNCITLRDGQILDYSKLGVSPSGCTIIASGQATIIGNSDIPLNDSQIIICTDEQITLKDVSVNAAKYQNAVEVRAKDAQVKFEGTNSFTGSSKEINDNDDFGRWYKSSTAVGASQGMLICENASVTLTGAKATFSGGAGGAGICTCGDLIIDNATIIANGSYSDETYYMDETSNQYVEDRMTVYEVGSGIGASVTYYSTNVMTRPYTYAKYGTVTIQNNSVVTANGAAPKGTSNCYSMDIGGITYFTEINSYSFTGVHTKTSNKALTGSISNSEIKTANGMIDKGITKSSSKFDKDSFTVTTSTAGSDGVTDNNISFKLYGKVDGKEVSTNGITKKCGEDKGEYTFSFSDTFIGSEITKIEIEIDGDDGWYPEYVKVTSDCGGIEQTLYGGRWLDNSGTITLKPTDNVFKIGITTSNDTNAGTDAAVYVQLVDQNGITSDKINASDVHPESNAFEKGDSMSLYMYAPDKFGKLQYIQINSDANGTAAANWKIEKLDAAQMSGGNKDDNFSITVNQWDPNGVTMSFGRETGKSGTFEFIIKTQNVTGAGTDATIKFKLIGTNGETNLVDVESFIDNYTSGDNFEKNDKDTGRITFKMPKGGIGTITGLYVESSGGAASADWDLEYVEITEILPDGEGQHVKFNAKCTIKKKSNKTLTNPSIVVKTVSPSINREILENLKMTDENSYLLSVNEPVTISYDVFKLLKDNGIDLTVEMLEGTDVLYSITFDGKEIKNFHDVTLGKNYEIRDGETLVNFLENSYIPEGTTINLYLDKLGFTENSVVSIYVKDENGNWSKIDTELSEGEIYHEIEITDGSDFILRSESTSVSGTDENTPVDKDVVSTGNTGMVVFVTLTFAVMGCLTLVGFSLSRKKKEQ